MFNQQVITKQKPMPSALPSSVPSTSFSQISCSDGSSGWRSDVGSSSLYFCSRGSAPVAASSTATIAATSNTYSPPLPAPKLPISETGNNSLGTMLPPSWNVSNLKLPWSSSSPFAPASVSTLQNDGIQSKFGQIRYNISSFGQFGSMNPLGSLGSVPAMMKQPTVYFNSFYNKVRHLLAGQGVEDVGDIDLTAAKVSIDKLGDCIEKMNADPVLMPEAYGIIHNWYTTIYRPLFQKLTDPSDALMAMSNSERERVFADADNKFAELIKGKSYEQAVYNHFLKCFA